MAEKESFRSLNENRKMFCEFCDSDGDFDQPADGFCVECVTYFCSVCLRFHEKFHPTHTQQGTDIMPKEFYTEKCSIHPKQLIKFYCLSCEDTACSSCKTDHHNQCVEIHHLPMLVKEFDQTGEFVNIHNSLQLAEKEIADIELFIDNEKREIEEHSIGINSAISTDKNEITALFDELENSTERSKINDISKLETEESEIGLMKSNIQNIKSEMEIKTTNVPKSKVFVATKEAKVKSEDVLRSLKEIKQHLDENERGKYRYVPAEHTSVGKLIVVKEGGKDNVLVWSLIVLLVSALVEGILLNGTVIKTNEMRLYFDPGQLCHVTDNLLAITFPDKTVNLISLRNEIEDSLYFYILLYMSPKLLYEIHVTENIFGLDGPPFTSITKVGDDQVAFLSPNGYILLQEVNTVKNLQSRQIHKKIWVSENGHHIVYSNDTFFILYGGEQQRIESYDMNGKQLLNLEISNLLQVVNPWNIAISPNHDIVYVSDVDVIIALTTDGQVRGYYRHADLLRPTGMTLDSAGFLYVCGYLSNNVFKISPDFSHGYELLSKRSHGLLRPFSISYSKKENELYVGSFGKKSMHVFKLKYTWFQDTKHRLKTLMVMLIGSSSSPKAWLLLLALAIVVLFLFFIGYSCSN